MKMGARLPCGTTKPNSARVSAHLVYSGLIYFRLRCFLFKISKYQYNPVRSGSLSFGLVWHLDGFKTFLFFFGFKTLYKRFNVLKKYTNWFIHFVCFVCRIVAKILSGTWKYHSYRRTNVWPISGCNGYNVNIRRAATNNREYTIEIKSWPAGSNQIREVEADGGEIPGSMWCICG